MSRCGDRDCIGDALAYEQRPGTTSIGASPAAAAIWRFGSSVMLPNTAQAGAERRNAVTVSAANCCAGCSASVCWQQRLAWGLKVQDAEVSPLLSACSAACCCMETQLVAGGASWQFGPALLAHNGMYCHPTACPGAWGRTSKPSCSLTRDRGPKTVLLLLPAHPPGILLPKPQQGRFRRTFWMNVGRPCAVKVDVGQRGRPRPTQQRKFAMLSKAGAERPGRCTSNAGRIVSSLGMIGACPPALFF